MLKNRKGPYIVLVVLILVVGGISIAYANLTQKLTLQYGTVTQVKHTWDIHFKDETVTASVNTGTDSGDSGNTYTGRSCGNITRSSATAISVGEVKLSKPGDRCGWLVTVQNTGTIGAYLNSIAATAPSGITCTNNTTSLTCGNIIYKIGASTSSDCSTAPTTGTSATIAKSTGTQQFYICAMYDSSKTAVSSTDVTQTGAKFTLNYSQK